MKRKSERRKGKKVLREEREEEEENAFFPPTRDSSHFLPSVKIEKFNQKSRGGGYRTFSFCSG